MFFAFFCEYDHYELSLLEYLYRYNAKLLKT